MTEQDVKDANQEAIDATLKALEVLPEELVKMIATTIYVNVFTAMLSSEDKKSFV